MVLNECNNNSVYKSQLNQFISSTQIDIIIISIVLSIQFIFTIIVIWKGYHKFKKIIQQKQSNIIQSVKNNHLNISNPNNLSHRQNKPNKNIIQTYIQPQKYHIDYSHQQTEKYPLIQKLLFRNPSKLKIISSLICYFVLFLLCITLLIMSFLAIYQTVYINYYNAQCNLNNKLTQFRNGSTNWIGLDNIVPNVTQLNLILNTRIQVSINAIKGLILNGTVATIKPGLGFANGTNITVINKITPLGVNKTNIIANSVKTNINASVRYWLFMNSSLSGTILFPVCQPNLTYPIQHPLISNKTIELNYMDDICGKVTKQVDDLVQNGGKVDQLLVDLQDVKATKASLQSNLSTLNNVYDPITGRTKQYGLQFSSFGYDFTSITNLSMIALTAYVGLSALMTTYIIYLIGTTFCDCCKSKQNEQEDQDTSSQIIITNFNNQLYENNKQLKRLRKFNNISSFLPKGFLILLIGVNVIVGLASFTYVKSGIQMNQICQNFNRAITDSNYFNQLSLKSNQKQLLTPIQQCTSSKNKYFMQNVQLLTSRFSLQKLYNLSLTYNSSVPKNIYNAQSLNQIQTLKQYLFHLQTMPIKSSQFNLIQLLNQINLYSNGSYSNSKQILDCGKTVIQDQYVYNAVDCKNKLMDLVNQVTITQPRCIILPTYDGTPGTVTTHLNQAQHTFVLNTTCPSVNNMFSPGNNSCFLGKRLALLQAQNCTKTAIQLGTRLQNIVKFSQLASSYTDIYMQNLRNVFGVYAVSSTNLTQFFAGTNMSQTLNGFGILSHNLLNRTRCDQINNIIYSVFDSYCNQNNTSKVLLTQGYIWSIIVVIGIIVQSIIFYLLDISIQSYRIQNYFNEDNNKNKNDDNYEKNRINKNGRKILAQQSIENRIQRSSNKIQVSQQTLIRNNIFNQQNNQFDLNININQIQNNTDNPIIFNRKKNTNQNIIKDQRNQQDKLIIQNGDNLVQQNSKIKYQTHSHTLDDTNTMFDKYSPSPNKSINPYGHISGVDYMNQTPKINQHLYPQLNSLNKLQTQNKINLLSSIKKNNINNKQPMTNQKYQQFNEFVKQPQSNNKLKQLPTELIKQQNNQVQQSNNQIRQSNNQIRQSNMRGGKLMMSQTGRRFKKINIETNQKNITPQLFFNLQQNQQFNHKFNNKMNNNKIKDKTKTQNISKQKNIKQKTQQVSNISKSRNFLQINIYDDQQDESKDIQLIQFNRKSKQKTNKNIKLNKESQILINAYDIQRKQSKTAR